MARFKLSSFILAGLCVLAGAHLAGAQERLELVYQNGRDGYAGTRTAQIVTSNYHSVSPGPHQVCNAALISYHTLLRFDEIADPLYKRLKEGWRIEKATLTLNWHSTTGCDRQWHVKANLLRRPWWPDGRYGPTWLAYVKGLGWWTKDGAGDDEQDQYPQQFGPALLASKTPVAELDVTAALTDPAYGKTAAERLRQFEQNGLVMRKQEDYPYAGWSIRFWGDGAEDVDKRPKLTVTLVKGATEDLGELPQALDMKALVAELEAEGGRGRSAFTVTDEMLQFLKEHPPITAAPHDPAWRMARRRELLALPTSSMIGGVVKSFDKGTPEGIIEANMPILNTGAAQWCGWTTWDFAIVAKKFWRAFLPSTQERIRNFFNTWLKTDQIEYVPDKVQWFRSRATWSGNEQLWNHPAMGEAVDILGGEVVGADHVVKEGTYWLNVFLEGSNNLGSIGEFVAPYYYAMTISAFQTVAEFAENPQTRLKASILEEKLMLDLIERYHAPSRQVVSPFSRSNPPFVVGAYDGMKYLLHPLCKSGVLIPNEDIFPQGSSPQGKHALYNVTVPPSRVAIVHGWQPDYACNIADEKPLPYRVVSFWRWGRDPNRSGYLTTYLDRHYGLASNSDMMMDAGQGFALTAYWQRTDRQIESLKEIGSLYTHYIANDRLPLQGNRYWWNDKLDNPDWGSFRNDGSYHCVQHDNKVIELAGPWGRENGHLTSLAHKVFICKFGGIEEIWLDGQRAEALPASARFGQRIFIKDGPCYVAIIPLDATDLGRKDEVTITEANQHLIISAYNFQSDEEATIEPEKLDAARAGFVIELAQQEDFPTLADFRTHVEKAKLTQTEQDGVWDVTYRSGGDVLEIAVRSKDKHTTRDCVVKRLVNGKSPFLPEGILRDSNCVVHGTRGELRKGDAAVLRTRPGLPVWLLVDPQRTAYEVVNPNPNENTPLELFTPQGMVSCERFGMGRLAFRPGSDIALEVHTQAPCTLYYPAEVDGAVVFNGSPVSVVSASFSGRQCKKAVFSR